MYKAINDLNRKKSRSSISVKDKNDKLIDRELVRNRWKEYIEKLCGLRKANPIVSMLNQQRIWILENVH